jgi:hypothetical protein
MKVVIAIFAAALLLPLLMIAAIALGPVALGIMCAVGFGLIVGLFLELVVGLGVLVGNAHSEHQRHVRMRSQHT